MEKQGEIDELPFAGLWDEEPCPFGTLRPVAGLVVMPEKVIAAAVSIIESTSVGPINDEGVIDLGCGEGGILVELARRGCKTVGVDILRSAVDTALAKSSRSRMGSTGTYREPEFRVGDIFEDTVNWTKAGSGITVVVLFLVPKQVQALRPALVEFLKARPGRRVLSYDYACDVLVPKFKHDIFPIYVYDSSSLPVDKTVSECMAGALDPKRRYLADKEARRLVRSVRGMLSPVECDRIINAVESVLKLGSNFERTHSAFATDDIPAFRLAPADYGFVAGLVSSRVLPELAENSQIPLRNLYCKDLFVVRYSTAEGGQRALELHRDGSSMSFSLLLSEAADFIGGGTFFAHLKNTVRPQERGTAVLHDSKALHAGAEITSGTRVVLVGFVECLNQSNPRAIDRVRQQVKHIRERHVRRAKMSESGFEEQELESILGMLSTGVAFEESAPDGSNSADSAEGRVEEVDDDNGTFGGILDEECSKYEVHEIFKNRTTGLEVGAENAFATQEELSGLLEELRSSNASTLRGGDESEEKMMQFSTEANESALSVEALTAVILSTADVVARLQAQSASKNSRRHVVLSVRPEDDKTTLEEVLDELKVKAQDVSLDISWGDWELQELCYGIKELVIAIEVLESVQLDDLIDFVESTEGVGSCEVRSSRPVTKEVF